MSACPCAHCSGTGWCQCFDCTAAARGERVARDRRLNAQFREAFTPVVSMTQSPLLALLMLPRTIAGAAQANESFPCTVCEGKGYNYIGRRR